MKNDIISYELGSFIDFKGNERMVIACAVSQSVNNTDKTQFTANWSNHDSDPILIVRVISIGIAVYNSEDEFDIEIQPTQVSPDSWRNINEIIKNH